MQIKNLEKKSLDLRRKTFIKFIEKGEAHLGGSFSMIEILIYLYEKILKKNDKFILSKSHASFPLSILLREKGLKTKLTTHLEIDKIGLCEPIYSNNFPDNQPFTSLFIPCNKTVAFL